MDYEINLKKLAEKIETSGMKRKAIAARMNLTAAGLANKLSGKRDFSASEINKIADVLNLTSDDILSIFFADIVDKTYTEN